MSERIEHHAVTCPPELCGAVALTGMDQKTCEDALTREFSVPVVPYCPKEGVRRQLERMNRDFDLEVTPADHCQLSQQLGGICTPEVLETSAEELISAENVL